MRSVLLPPYGFWASSLAASTCTPWTISVALPFLPSLLRYSSYISSISKQHPYPADNSQMSSPGFLGIACSQSNSTSFPFCQRTQQDFDSHLCDHRSHHFSLSSTSCVLTSPYTSMSLTQCQSVSLSFLCSADMHRMCTHTVVPHAFSEPTRPINTTQEWGNKWGCPNNLELPPFCRNVWKWAEFLLKQGRQELTSMTSIGSLFGVEFSSKITVFGVWSFKKYHCFSFICLLENDTCHRSEKSMGS